MNWHSYGRAHGALIRLKPIVVVLVVLGLGSGSGRALAAPLVGSDEKAPEAACESGVVLDDGSVESGYGFVPSSVTGSYVQLFRRDQFEAPYLKAVCVCWLKTRGGHEIEFDIVLFDEVNGRPAAQPRFRFPARMENVPDSVETAGRFESVNVGLIPLPTEDFFLGVEWNPKKYFYLFVCVDQAENRERTEVLFRENVQPSWANIRNSADPIFKPHRAIMIRALSGSRSPQSPVPGASAPPRLDRSAVN